MESLCVQEKDIDCKEIRVGEMPDGSSCFLVHFSFNAELHITAAQNSCTQFTVWSHKRTGQQEANKSRDLSEEMEELCRRSLLGNWLGVSKGVAG